MPTRSGSNSAPGDTAEGPAPGLRLRLTKSVLMAGASVGLILLGAFPCPTAFLLRIPCPGCGLTRATKCLLTGDLAGMWRFHPAAPLVLLFLAVYLGPNLVAYLWSGRWGWVDERMGRKANAATWGVLIVLLAVWGARFCGMLGGPVPV